MAWSQLPDGETITFRPGYSYAVVASVKANHTRADDAVALTPANIDAGGAGGAGLFNPKTGARFCNPT